MRTLPRRPFVVLRISSCAATLRRRFPTLKQRSQRRLTSLSMWNVNWGGEPFEKCCDSLVTTGGRSSFGLNPSTGAKQPPLRGVSTMSKCQEIARQFLSEWFRPDETFALLARYPQSSRTLQRIVRLPDLVSANYLGWLAFENSRGATSISQSIRSRLARRSGLRARSL